ncbi:UDP-N-acetylglucosamine 1-carboxyvinyltransferase [Streptomyces narbonensis]
MPRRLRLPLRPAQLPALGGRLGTDELQGADLVIPDLRGGFSYLIAALAAQGTSRVHGIELINRGYENFMEKLVELGAKVELPGQAPCRPGNTPPCSLCGPLWGPHRAYERAATP